MNEDFEVKSEDLYNKLKEIIENDESFQGFDEELIYALGQIVADKISFLESSDEDKGAIVSGITNSMKDIFHTELIFYKERLRLLNEQKSSTLH